MKKIWIIILGLLLVSCSSAVDSLGDISGYYEGSIALDGSDLPMTMLLEVDEKLTGTIDIAVQNTYGLIIDEVVYSKDEVTFTITLGPSKGVFTGGFIEDTFVGQFAQNGYTFPFEFIKAELPSTEGLEKVSYKDGETEIIGELMIPESTAKMPVALIIAGSGMTDMNGNSNGGVFTNSYKYLAEALRENGIASLRYNKRSIGYIGQEEGISFDDFVDDAKGLTDLLLNDNRFSDVYVIGHSQGALIAELVAIEKEIEKLVLLAGVGRPIDDIILEQVEGQLEATDVEVLKDVFEKNKMGEVVEVPDSLTSIARVSVQPFLMSWMKYDPVKVMSTIAQPTLIVSGDVDIQVPLKDATLLLAASDQAELVVITGMNHILKETTSDREENIKTYQNINLPLHSGLVDALIEFLIE